MKPSSYSRNYLTTLTINLLDVKSIVRNIENLLYIDEDYGLM